MHRRIPTIARAEQSAFEEDLKELQSRFQAWASRLDRSAASLVFRAAFAMASAFRFSKRIGFTGVGDPGSKLFAEAGVPGGCFSSSKALGSPAANCLLRQVFLEDVSHQGFHG